MIGGIISFLKRFGSGWKRNATVSDGTYSRCKSFDLQEWYESEADLDNDINRFNGYN